VASAAGRIVSRPLSLAAAPLALLLRAAAAVTAARGIARFLGNDQKM